jgi:hypothetical protein
MHDDQGTLRPLPIRQTFEIVFGYNQREGTLELFAKMGTEMKPKLERLFGQIILGEDLGPNGSDLPYDLNRLKDRYFCLDIDPEDHITVSIRKLRIEVPHRARFLVEPFNGGRNRDVFEVIEECMNEENVVWDEIDITMATFNFQFQPLAGRRGGSLTVDVTYPDYCSVNSRRPERIEFTRKYLKRWRIANV